MNRKVDFTQLGGLYVYQDSLDFLQASYSQSIDALAAVMGDKVILSGVTEDQPGIVAPGWIVVGGEVFPFVGGAKAQYIRIEEIVTPEQFDDGTQKNVYSTRRAVFANIPDGNFAFADLKRLAYNSATLKDAMNNIQSVIKCLVNFTEDSVIISGCDIAVNGPTLNVSAGVVLFNGNMVASQPYAGGYPVYMDSTGNWQGAQPAGSYILFDPYTSQRYVDVLTRATTKPGKIEMYETLSDRFDANGIGRWEMKGFQLAASMQGYAPVGYWFDGITVPNVTDQKYKIPGQTVGENTHQLTIDEMPKHRFRSGIHSQPGSLFNEFGDDGIQRNGWRIHHDNDKYSLSYTEYIGSDEAHENRPPMRVVVYVKRTA